MGADSKLMEAILRVEHKLDLLLDEKMNTSLMKMASVGSLHHYCPLCTQPVQYDVDIQDSVVIRKCGCSTGKIALDLKAFAPPVPVKKTEKEDVTGTNQEDWSNPDRRGRPR